MAPCWLLVLIIFTVQRTLAVPGALVWKSANNSCAITTAPIIFNQLTVVGDACGNLRGFDAAGKLKYSVSAYSNITSVLVWSEVALIAGTASGKLIAYFSALHRQPTVTVDVTSGSTITALINTLNDLIAVGSDDGHLHVLQFANLRGQYQFIRKWKSEPLLSPVTDVIAGRPAGATYITLVAQTPKALIGFRLGSRLTPNGTMANGTLVWRQQGQGLSINFLNSTLATSKDGLLLFATVVAPKGALGPSLCAFNMLDGSLFWSSYQTYPTGDPNHPTSFAVTYSTGGTLTPDGKYVLVTMCFIIPPRNPGPVVCSSSTIAALDVRNGTAVRRRKSSAPYGAVSPPFTKLPPAVLPSPFQGAPAVAFVGGARAYGHGLSGFGLGTGGPPALDFYMLGSHVKPSAPAGPMPPGSSVVNRIYVGDYAGSVWAFSLM